MIPKWFWSTSLAVLTCLIVLPAAAHFLLNLNVRVLHIEHRQGELQIYLRTPMPYLVADKVGPESGDALPAPAPFTTNAIEDGQLVHFVDPDQIAADPFGLGEIVERGFEIVTEGQRLSGTVTDLRLHRVGDEPGFATLAEAQDVFADSSAGLSIPPPLYVGDALVDVLISYETGEPISVFSVASTLNPGLPGQEDTANLILDYGPGNPKVFRSRGLLNEPVEISRSSVAAIWTFVVEGVRHILEGLDHVLFVVCLVLGATTLHSLLWRVTGFTVGHSVTLALGFFGFVPSGAWFVPAVETGIALSIIYAAFVAIRKRTDQNISERNIVVVTMAIGLLHGLGFSFVLQEILQVTSPNIWQSLLAFNVGVEIGQLIIVLPLWLLFTFLSRNAQSVWRVSRIAVAIGCIGIAGYWTIERVGQLTTSIA